MLKNYFVILKSTGETLTRFTETSKKHAEELAEDLGYDMNLCDVAEDDAE